MLPAMWISPPVVPHSRQMPQSSETERPDSGSIVVEEAIVRSPSERIRSMARAGRAAFRLLSPSAAPADDRQAPAAGR
jgi:hypothetical protein